MVDDPRAPTVQQPPGTPRWVKALAIAAILAVVVVVGAMLIVGGRHGPGQHSAASAVAGPVSGVLRVEIAVR